MSSHRPPYHDDEMAELLRTLDVPDHDDDFFARLDQELARTSPGRGRALRRIRASGRPHRRWLLAVALVGVAVAASVVLTIRNTGVEQAGAAQIRGRVAAA